MERTPRLIRLALAGLPVALDPWMIFRGSLGGVGGGAGGEGTNAAGATGGGDGCEDFKGAFAARAKGGQLRGQEDGGSGEDVKQQGGGTEDGGLAGAGRSPSLRKYNPYPDLVNQTSGSLCETVWGSRPLVLYDKHLVSAKEQTIRANEGGGVGIGEALDISKTITRTLKRHPGPIRSFRVDSSKWEDDQELSQKLKTLRLGFVGLPDLDLYCFNYSALQVLDLFCCNFQGLKLAWIINDCVTLRELRISYCKENLTVNSKGLERVHLWGNTANQLVIQSAPKLIDIVTGITPGGERAKTNPMRFTPQVSVSINDTPALKSIRYLLLPYQDVTVNGIPIAKETMALTSVQDMKIGLYLSNRTQRDRLRKILDSLPMLLDLSVLRMDAITPSERFEVAIDEPFDDIDKVVCVKMHLRRFSIEDFRGGPAEKHIIKCILSHAPHLLMLNAKCCATSSKEDTRQAVKEIRGYEQLSEGCQVKFQS
ncbi:unnamed protein product [Urochloa decumbens]|uniref:F-box/LRR-repeat protein 15/At3g58940/PEG3-like LRR domain-containing protein n=1 Tax=Urochloa decumbens TaxID=240449 RepID=A0ABC8XNM9_9POAL